jgi:Xaa-Pro aminopeptidase
VRIEDDVAVTKDGQEVLTGALVKDPDGIEKWMSH